MRHPFNTIFLGHPIEHTLTTIVVEVDIDIRQGDTVGIEETLKQQVIFQRVQIRDFQAICYNGASRRSTARTHRNAQFFSGGTDIIAHDEEVAWEAHGLHHMQLKLDTLHLLVGKFLSIAFVCAFPCQFFQKIGFELDTVETVVAAQLLHLLLGIFLAHDDIAMLITGELVEQVFLGEFLAVFLLSTKVFGDGEFRHDRIGVDAIGFHLVDNLLCVLQHLGMVGEDTPHLFGRLQPFLLGVVHARWVIEVFACA